MRKLSNQENVKVKGGDLSARMFKQMRKCEAGSARACRRMMRMYVRHMM